jgi:hypothetical protein
MGFDLAAAISRLLGREPQRAPGREPGVTDPRTRRSVQEELQRQRDRLARLERIDAQLPPARPERRRH